MTAPIYKLWMAKPAEAWYQLSEEEQRTLLARAAAHVEEVKARSVIRCASGWSSEQWPFFGVEEYPDIEAVQKHTEFLNGLDWFRYIESMSLLGVEWTPPSG